jgi:hypothetical protein
MRHLLCQQTVAQRMRLLFDPLDIIAWFHTPLVHLHGGQASQ